MAVNTSASLFTSGSVSDPQSPLVAGVISYNGLIPILGTTGTNGDSETEIGLINVTSYNDWLSRLNQKGYLNGPTGSWAGEWWAVHNYLLYGGKCYIGGTGSTGDYFINGGGFCASSTPLHNKNLVDIQVIFDAGNTFSSGAAVNIATTRQDCVAIIGNNNKITTPLTQAYDNHVSDFGITTGSEHVIYVAGRKKFTAGINNIVTIREANLSPDVAGCVARSARDARIWAPPAGKNRGAIKGILSLQQNFSESDSVNLLNGRVNPVKTFPGEGTFFFGNQTAYTGSLNYLDKINVMLMVSYLKKELLKVAQSLLYEINNANTRQRFVNNATTILENLTFQNGVDRFKIVCNEINNPVSVVQENKLVADVYVQPVFAAETIQITIINTTESQIFTS